LPASKRDVFAGQEQVKANQEFDFTGSREMKNSDKRKTRFNFDSILALVAIGFAVFLIIYQLNMPKSAIRQALGPSFVPVALLIGMILTAIVLFFNSLQMERKASATASIQEETETKTSAKQKKGMIMILLGLLVYAVILTPLGFIISTTLCILYQTQLFEKGKWVRNLVVSIPFSFLVYYIFVYRLEIILPAGILEILAP
jgi:putative tricarboxylic transport membrane protein